MQLHFTQLIYITINMGCGLIHHIVIHVRSKSSCDWGVSNLHRRTGGLFIYPCVCRWRRAERSGWARPSWVVFFPLRKQRGGTQGSRANCWYPFISSCHTHATLITTSWTKLNWAGMNWTQLFWGRLMHLQSEGRDRVEENRTHGWQSLMRSWSVVAGGRPLMYRLVLLSCSTSPPPWPPPPPPPPVLPGLGGAMGGGGGA